MPFTLAHPLLVLPLRRFTPRWLDFPALVAGSMAPDLFYFIGQRRDAMPAHWPLEGLPSSFPAGAAMLAAFYLTRRPLANLLPRPWRRLCLEACLPPSPLTLRNLSRQAASLLLGIWGHFFWDSFTHPWGWFVQQIPLLQAKLGYLGPFRIDGSRLAQYASSLFGLLALAWLLQRWRRRAAPAEPLQWDGRRGLLWITITTVALAAGCLAAGLSPTPAGILFYFSTAAVSTAALTALVAAYLLPPAP